MPVGLVADGANRNDMKLVEATLQSIPEEVEKRRQEALEHSTLNLTMDKGYDYPEVRELVEAFGFEAHIRSRGEEKKEKKRSKRFRARRWVVERTHSWMNRYRRILIRWEKKAENYLAFVQLAAILIIYRKLRHARTLSG